MMKHQLFYLVNLCHSMDDVPMGLFENVDAAFEYAKALDWTVPPEMYQRLELPTCSTPVCVTVTTFRGGVPISRVVVRDFEDEETEEWAGDPEPRDDGGPY